MGTIALLMFLVLIVAVSAFDADEQIFCFSCWSWPSAPMIPSGEIFPENNKGLLLDGRNRAEAWDRFPPTLAINLKRRHRSKGQQARHKLGDARRGWAMLG